MNILKKMSLPILILVLVGQGCLPFGSKEPSGVGGFWQTVDDGKNWTTLSTLMQSSGNVSIAGVNVRDIEIDPSDPAVYYIATEQNGIFYSYDAGTSWQRPKSEEVRSGPVQKIEVDPTNICTLYVVRLSEILKSTSCGRKFESVYKETRAEERLSAFSIDWFNANTLWAGTTAGEILSSEDGGKNWTTVVRLPDEITALEVSNTDSRIVLAGTKSNGLYRFDPDENTWTGLEKELSKQYRESDKVYAFAQTKTGNAITMSTKYGLLLSRDLGKTWQGLSLLTAPGDIQIWSVAMDPEDSNTIYYATINTFYTSTDGGQSWVTEAMPTNRAARALTVNPSDTTRILAGFAAVK